MLFHLDEQTTSSNYLKQAVEWSRTPNPIIEFNLALVMAEQGQFGDAEALLRKLLQHNPFFEPAWQLLVIVQYPRAGLAESLELLQVARETVGDSLRLRYLSPRMMTQTSGLQAAVRLQGFGGAERHYIHSEKLETP